MIFKKSKYNIVFLLMFMLVIGVFGFEVFLSSSPTQVIVPDNGPNAEDPTGPGGDDPNLPVDPTDPGGDVVDDGRDPNVPKAQFPLNIVNYSINKLYNGAGFKSTYDKKMVNTAAGMDVIQNINGTIERSGNVAYEALTFGAEGSMASYGANYKRHFYFDGNNVIKYQTAKKDDDISTAKVTNMTADEYKQNLGMNLTEKPVFNFSAANFKASLETKKSSNGKEYYEITVTSKSSSVFTSDYLKYYESSGDLKNVKGVSVTYKFFIYKASGRLFQIQTNEVLEGNHPATGFHVDSVITSTQTFTAMASPFEIKKPI